jgi:hypothetical protein
MEPVYFLMLSENELAFIRHLIAPQWRLARADEEDDHLYCLEPVPMPTIDIDIDKLRG